MPLGEDRFVPLTEQAGMLGSGTGEDTAASGLGTALAQINALQQRPLIPDNPMSQLGAVLSGFASGYAGRPNPALSQAMDERALALKTMQTQAQLGMQNAQLQETRRLRDLQTKTELRKDELERIKLKLSAADAALKDANIKVRKWGYDIKKGIPVEYGGIDPNADTAQLALMSGPEFEKRHDEAIMLLSAGIDPADPIWQGRFDGLPVAQYKEVIGKNPLAASTLLKTKMSPADFFKSVRAQLSMIPAEQLTAQQQQMLLAVQDVEKPVNLGDDFNRIGLELAQSDPTFGAFTPNRPVGGQAARINDQIEARKPPTVERLTGLIATAEAKGDMATAAKYRRQRSDLVGQLATIQGAKTEATQAALPLPAEERDKINAIFKQIGNVEILKTFSPEEIRKYTGIWRNPLQRGQMLLKDALGQPVDERFAQFDALMGNFQANLFELAGKQLTGFEGTVARMSTPTGRETGGAAEMLAKAEYLAKFLRLAAETRQTLATVGKGKLDLTLLESAVKSKMREIGMQMPTRDNPRPWLSPEEQRKLEAPPPGFREATPR